jgi:hypothetical protein
MQLANDDLCIIMLHLTFGSTPCPFEWNIISKIIRNLANAILHDDAWDPTALFAPCQHLISPMVLLDNSILFAEDAIKLSASQ